MYNLVWVAFFKDTPLPLFQYHASPEDGSCVEVPFSQVLEKQDLLTQFALINRQSRTWYSVNLKHGTIGIAKDDENSDGPRFPEPRTDMLRNDGIKYRLIYFREVTRNFDSQLKEVDQPDIVYFLGFQYTDNEGHNHKRLMQIHADGRLVIN